MPTAPVLALTGVSLVRDGRTILDRIDWRVVPGDRWIVLGPNGSGKTSLCRLAGLYLHPSKGDVDVLGKRLGRTDVRELRTRLGMTSQALADMLRPGLQAVDLVMTGRNAALAPYWHRYDDADRERAMGLLARFGCARLATARYATLSAGERQRVMLARALMSDPPLLLLDEPAAGLDLAGREQLVAMLADVAADRAMAAIVLVTHHVDEIPRGFTHVLMLADGRIAAQGPIADTLTAENLSRCFGLRLALARQDGRWMAWGR
ncbi:MAG: ABC transporter ATP-binding protein [Acidobacteria bacterium]|nr:ABC transporter ATP-binding protein [Acidobacteriota bacterium]